MKICFIGAGSTIFAKNVLGDCILTPELGSFEIALYDIDPVRLDDSFQMLNNINENYRGKALIKKYTNRLEAFRNASYLVNAIQVGGYEPLTVMDFNISKKYGLRHTIGDTLGVPGIFRGLRTIKVMEEMAVDIKKVCPNAILLNYVNPMAIVSGYVQRYLGIKTIGLCHSVQVCASGLLKTFKLDQFIEGCKWKIAGINHQAWLLSIEDKEGHDLYPLIKERNLSNDPSYDKKWDLVRLEMMKVFGYYITESSEHTSEYTPWFIKRQYPELIEKFNIPLDEYPRRCVKQIEDWKHQREELVSNVAIKHEKSREYAADIIKAIETNSTYQVNGNVMNNGFLIDNLPEKACVEVPCLIDGNGITPCHVGSIPEQCAALNRTNINVQILAMEGAHDRSKSTIIQAACLDPHTASELSLGDIKALVNEMFECEKDYLPAFK